MSVCNYPPRSTQPSIPPCIWQVTPLSSEESSVTLAVYTLTLRKHIFLYHRCLVVYSQIMKIPSSRGRRKELKCMKVHICRRHLMELRCMKVWSGLKHMSILCMKQYKCQTWPNNQHSTRLYHIAVNSNAWNMRTPIIRVGLFIRPTVTTLPAVSQCS